jgi:hypothetical protein
MTLRRRVGTWILFQLFFFYGLAQKQSFFAYNPKLIEAETYIGALQLQDAWNILQAEMKLHPENKACNYLLHTWYFYQLITTGSKTLYTNSDYVRKNQLAAFTGNVLSPASQAAKADMLLHEAILKLMYKEYFSGAYELRSAYQLLKQQVIKHPEQLSNLKNLGFMKAVLGTLPENFHWILNIVGLGGNLKEGMELLEKYLQHPRFNQEVLLGQQQAHFYYCLLQFHYLSPQTAWTHAQKHTEDFEQNPLNGYLRAFIAANTAHNDEALNVLLQTPNNPQYSKFYDAEHLTGYVLLNKLDVQNAAIYFKKYVTFGQKPDLKKDAYLRLAWIALLNGDTFTYHTYRNLAFKASASKDEEDLAIDIDLSKKVYPNPIVLKARLLYDGGYYTQAENMMKTTQVSAMKSKYQQAEYYFRYGLILKEQKRYTKAIECFTESIKIGEKSPLYLAAFSALQIGYIYQLMEFEQSASYYFNKAMAYKNHPAKEYVNQKAKQALADIKIPPN